MKSKQKLSVEITQLNSLLRLSLKNFLPPESLTVSEWADKYRKLSSENSAEAGKWKTTRTPYLKEPMNAFTDSHIRKITVVASSQVGKTEMLLNMLAYLMDIDPGAVMFVMPTVEIGQDFSKRRVSSMIRDCRHLKNKVSDAKGRDSNNTVLKKSFPGGMLTITGSNSPASLAGTPSRYIFGDERDRWATCAGTEGDPWGLLEARTTTFYNSKMVEVSTPTVKGYSAIEKSYNQGTRELWCQQCPHCKEWHNIVFKDIKFDFEKTKVKNHTDFKVTSVFWACPSCGSALTESEMRKQPAKWIAGNEAALENGHRSFWINAFVSPWMGWHNIVLRFLQAESDPQMLKVVKNTILGELWEERGEIEDTDELLTRREDYGAELADGILVLTCGVDTQDDRLEYEVMGHGHYGETWGIEKGIIYGKPDTTEVWERLDDIIDHTYKFKNNVGLKISITCVDSGGHFTSEVYKQCRTRQNKRVFAIKGKGGDGIPFTKPATKIPINDNRNVTCWLYSLGVDAGKATIINSLKVQTHGRSYSHFPLDSTKGYDSNYFNGLISERLVPSYSNGQTKWLWEKIPGHNRNEALDCRNYALAAFRILNPDIQAVERRLKGTENKDVQPKQPKKIKRKQNNDDRW